MRYDPWQQWRGKSPWKGKQCTYQGWPPCLVGEGKEEEPLCGLPTLQPFQRDLPPGCLHALPLSLLTQDFCICCSLCLSERPSPETSTAPLGLSIHFWLPKGNFPCPLDHNHSPTYAIIASFSRGTFHGEMLLFTYVFLRLMSISPTWAWTHWGQE